MRARRGCGLLNGVLVTCGQVPALVVTLGTLYVFRGLAFLWTSGRQINAETLPDAFLNLGTDSIAGVPMLVLIALVVVLVRRPVAARLPAPAASCTRSAPTPRARGSPACARSRRVLAAFVLAGALAGLGGVLFTARFGTVDATAGTGYELTVIAAAVVGGVAIFGGVGHRLRRRARRAAARHDHVVADHPGVEAFWQQAAIGALLLSRSRSTGCSRCASRPPCAEGARAVQTEAVTPRDAPPARRRRAAARLARALLGRWETLLVGLLIVLAIAGQIISPEFLTTDSFTTGSLDLSEVALMALPLTLVIIAAEIDLSVASVLGLSSALMGYLWNHGQPIETIIPICLVAGALCGAFNGLLVTRLGLPSLAVTIGTLALFRGLAFVVIGDQSVTDFPALWTDRAFGNFAGTFVPDTIVLFAVLAVVFGVLLHATPFGRSIFAIGANEEAAHFSGLRVKRIKLIAVRRSRARSPRSPASSSRCATRRPRPTSARASS